MKKLFPCMMDRPGNGNVFGIFIYWFFGFVIFPFVLPILAVGSWDNLVLISWIEIVYYLINFGVVITMLKSYLSDSFFTVRIKPAKFIKTVLLTFAMMITAVLMCVSFDRLISGYTLNLLSIFPVTEFSVLISPDYLVTVNPVFGTLCMTVIAPVSISGLFYASGFAPVCYKKPWLAYIVVSLLLLLITGFDIFWRGNAESALLIFIVRLPVHLFACWSYQKTDTIWTPAASLTLFNLTMSLLCIAAPKMNQAFVI